MEKKVLILGIAAVLVLIIVIVLLGVKLGALYQPAPCPLLPTSVYSGVYLNSSGIGHGAGLLINSCAPMYKNNSYLQVAEVYSLTYLSAFVAPIGQQSAQTSLTLATSSNYIIICTNAYGCIQQPNYLNNLNLSTSKSNYAYDINQSNAATNPNTQQVWQLRASGEQQLQAILNAGITFNQGIRNSTSSTTITATTTSPSTIVGYTTSIPGQITSFTTTMSSTTISGGGGGGGNTLLIVAVIAGIVVIGILIYVIKYVL